jgi:hypothetical protein
MDIHTLSVSITNDGTYGPPDTGTTGSWILTILIILFGGIAVVVGCYYWRCRRRREMAEDHLARQSTSDRSFYPETVNPLAPPGARSPPSAYPPAYAGPPGYGPPPGYGLAARGMDLSPDDAIPPTAPTFVDSGGPVSSSSRA